jgi:uncharacterized protein GlcG (DUF336 family)
MADNVKAPVLSLASANVAIAAAVRHAERISVPSTVTVLDAGGRLVAAGRVDGAPLISVDASAAKARTAVFFKTATADLVAAIQRGAPLYTIADATTESLTFLGGGVPLLSADGQLIGAVGSGGGARGQDAEIASAGAVG